MFRKEKSFNPHTPDATLFNSERTKSVLNKRAKCCPLIQPTFGSFLSNYAKFFEVKETPVRDRQVYYEYSCDSEPPVRRSESQSTGS